MNHKIKHSVFDDKILVEHHAKYGKFEAQIVRWVIDTKDKVIRENLIALGWTPPGVKPPRCPYVVGSLEGSQHCSLAESSVARLQAQNAALLLRIEDLEYAATRIIKPLKTVQNKSRHARTAGTQQGHDQHDPLRHLQLSPASRCRWS